MRGLLMRSQVRRCREIQCEAMLYTRHQVKSGVPHFRQPFGIHIRLRCFQKNALEVEFIHIPQSRVCMYLRSTHEVLRVQSWHLSSDTEHFALVKYVCMYRLYSSANMCLQVTSCIRTSYFVHGPKIPLPDKSIEKKITASFPSNSHPSL